MTNVKKHKNYLLIILMMTLAAAFCLAGGLSMSNAGSGLPNDNSLPGELKIDYYFDLNGTTASESGKLDNHTNYASGGLSGHERLRTRDLNADYVWAMARGTGESTVQSANSVFCDHQGNPLTITSGVVYTYNTSDKYVSVVSSTAVGDTKRLLFTAKTLKKTPQVLYVYVKSPQDSANYYRVQINMYVLSTLRDLSAAAASQSIDDIRAEWKPYSESVTSVPSIVKITDGSSAALNLETMANSATSGGGLGISFLKDSGDVISGTYPIRDFSDIDIKSFSVEGTYREAIKTVNDTNYMMVSGTSGKNVGIILKADLKDTAYDDILRKDATSTTRVPIKIDVKVKDSIDNSKEIKLTFYVVVVADNKPVILTDNTHLEINTTDNKEHELKATNITVFNRLDSRMEISSLPAKTDDSNFLEIALKKESVGTNGEQSGYLTIKAKASGNTTLMIAVTYYYKNSSGIDTSNTLIVPVTVSASGNVEFVSIPIKGKAAAVIYSDGRYKTPGNKVQKGLFDAVINQGYILIHAESYNPAPAEGESVNGSKYISVEFDTSNGVIKITPLASTEGSRAYARLTFKNTSGVTRQYILEIETNLKGGSIFARFEDWEIALIIIGMVLGIFLLVLLLVRIIIVSAAKKKQEALATAAPTSAYIIKLNSTIAAAQAQTRMMTQQPMLALNSPTQPQTLQLGYYNPAPNQQQPGNFYQNPAPAEQPVINNYNYNPSPQSYGRAPSDPITGGNTFGFNPGPNNQSLEDIVLPITDDELIERIFVEKYEPKGMTRRSYFKNETLKKRELDKEKERIRELIRTGVSPEEAVKSSVKKDSNPVSSTPMSNPAFDDPAYNPVTVEDDYSRYMTLYIKYIDSAKTSFDEFYNSESMKNNVLIKDLMGESGLNDEIDRIILPDINDTRLQEEIKFDKNNERIKNLEQKVSGINYKYQKVVNDLDSFQADIQHINEDLAKSTKLVPELDEEIVGLNVKLSTAKSKDKDKIALQINEKENQIKNSKDLINRLNQNIATKSSDISKMEENKNRSKSELDMVNNTIKTLKSENVGLDKIIKEKKAKEAAVKDAYERAEKRDTIKELLYVPNRLDLEIKELIATIDINNKQKEELKSEIAGIQTRLLATTDVKLISSLSDNITKLNGDLSRIEKDNARISKSRSDKQIEMTSSRRKANDQIDQLDVPVEDIIKVEDEILGELAYERYIEQAHREQQDAELNLSAANAKYEASSGNFAELALRNAEAVSAAESAAVDAELELQMALSDKDIVQKELDDLNDAFLTASEEEQLDLGLKQFDLMQALEEKQIAYDKANNDFLKAREGIERVKADGIKANLESQMLSEKKSEEAVRALDEAKQRYESASDKLARAANMTSPTDLIVSGAGLISQDRKSVEAANLKKQLEKSKGEVEQAKMQAQLARVEAEQKAEIARLESEQKAELARLEAERKILEAERAGEVAKVEAERNAQEAVKRAEIALSEAERKAREEANEMTDAVKAELEAARAEAARAKEDANRLTAEAKATSEEKIKQDQVREEKIQDRIRARKNELNIIRADIDSIKTEEDGSNVLNKLNRYEQGLDSSDKLPEVVDLIDKIRGEARHAQELAAYKGLANREPPVRRTIKTIKENINHRPASARPGARPAGARPAGARPAGAGARPAGARPTGARPAGAGARPTGARPAGAGARPTGARPAGARPTGARPAGSSTGARPTGARPTGARPAARPTGNRPPNR